MIFRLYDFEASALMWAEQQTVNITDGIYTVYLGDSFNYIKAENGFGMRLGAFDAPEALSVESGSGNVGIGVADPAYNLDVAGNIHASGWVDTGPDPDNLCVVLETGLDVSIYNNQRFVVDCQTIYVNGNASNFLIGGGDFSGWEGPYEEGYWYVIENDNNISVCRGNDWENYQFRIRI